MKTVIEMAREAGWMHEHDSETGFIAEAAFKFAELVRADEREACAALCFDIWNRWLDSPEEDRHKMLYDAEDCADAIRARGETHEI